MKDNELKAELASTALTILSMARPDNGVEIRGSLVEAASNYLVALFDHETPRNAAVQIDPIHIDQDRLRELVSGVERHYRSWEPPGLVPNPDVVGVKATGG